MLVPIWGLRPNLRPFWGLQSILETAFEHIWKLVKNWIFICGNWYFLIWNDKKYGLFVNIWLCNFFFSYFVQLQLCFLVYLFDWSCVCLSCFRLYGNVVSCCLFFCLCLNMYCAVYKGDLPCGGLDKLLHTVFKGDWLSFIW